MTLYPKVALHTRRRNSGPPMRLHTTIFKPNVKDRPLIRQIFVYSANISSPGSMTTVILTGMKVIFLAVGGLVLLFIVNAFLGGNPLG